MMRARGAQGVVYLCVCLCCVRVCVTGVCVCVGGVLTSSSRKCADDAGQGGTRRRVPVCVFMLCACAFNGCVCVCWGGVDK